MKFEYRVYEIGYAIERGEVRPLTPEERATHAKHLRDSMERTELTWMKRHPFEDTFAAFHRKERRMVMPDPTIPVDALRRPDLDIGRTKVWQSADRSMLYLRTPGPLARRHIRETA